MQDEKQNHWAKTNTGADLHISDADSGANGYLCPGCTAKMIAHKGKKNEHFYRHHPNEIEKHRKCTFSNEEYRIKVAKEILQRIKEIKLPPLYIPIPPEHGGGKHKLKTGKIISTVEVLVDRIIYEDERGEVIIDNKYKPLKEGSHVLLNPDLIFTNVEEPILFIFFKKRTKLKDEEVASLKNFNINAIEITIPEYYNSEEIEKMFYSAKYTKWIFNHEQNTKFKPDSRGSASEGDGDPEYEGDFSEYDENFNCTSFRVKETIRRIRKLMARPEFIQAEEDIGNEIKKLETESGQLEQEYQRRFDDARSDVNELKAGITKEIQGIKFTLGDENKRRRKEAERRIGSESKLKIDKVDQDIGDFEVEQAGLERRYFDKKGQIERLHRLLSERNSRYKRELEREETALTREIAEFEGGIAGIEQKERNLDDEIRTEKSSFEYYTRVNEEQKRKLEDSRGDIQRTEEEINGIRERKGRLEIWRKKLSAAQDEAIQRRYYKS